MYVRVCACEKVKDCVWEYKSWVCKRVCKREWYVYENECETVGKYVCGTVWACESVRVWGCMLEKVYIRIGTKGRKYRWVFSKEYVREIMNTSENVEGEREREHV